jgi:hypothetical protein
MSTTAANTAKKSTAAKKAAPKKAAKKVAKPRATKAKAAPVAPQVAVAAFAEAYGGWYAKRIASTHDSAKPWLPELAHLCDLAGCERTGEGHPLAECRIKDEVTGLMSALQRACLPAFGRNRAGTAAATLTYRLAELNA